MLQEILKNFSGGEAAEIKQYFADVDSYPTYKSNLGIGVISITSPQIFFDLYSKISENMLRMKINMAFDNGDFVIFNNGNYITKTNSEYSQGRVSFTKEIKGINYFDTKPNFSKNMLTEKINIFVAINYHLAKEEDRNDSVIAYIIVRDLIAQKENKKSQEYIRFLNSLESKNLPKNDEAFIELSIDDNKSNVVKYAIDNTEKTDIAIHQYTKKALEKLKRDKCKECSSLKLYKTSSTVANLKRKDMCTEVKILIDFDSNNQAHGHEE